MEHDSINTVVFVNFDSKWEDTSIQKNSCKTYSGNDRNRIERSICVSGSVADWLFGHAWTASLCDQLSLACHDHHMGKIFVEGETECGEMVCDTAIVPWCCDRGA